MELADAERKPRCLGPTGLPGPTVVDFEDNYQPPTPDRDANTRAAHAAGRAAPCRTCGHPCGDHVADADRCKHHGCPCELARWPQTVVAVDPALEGPHVDYDNPADGAVPPSDFGYLRVSVGDERGAVYIDLPRVELEDLTSGELGLRMFEMLKALDERNEALQQEDDD